MRPLREFSTKAPENLNKENIKAERDELVKKLDDLQNLLYAEHKRSILIILQGLDAAGKDGLIRDVFKHVNPMGVNVVSFKKPTEEEMDHDFLWRIHRHAPRKGMIQIFNRSHYEDVLIQRVHQWIDEPTAYRRFDHINNFEKLLSDSGTAILKFYLHVSRAEQQERLQERITNPKKNWKYNPNDHRESERWDEYMEVYQDVFNHCSEIRWHIVPADQNWYKEYYVAKTLVETLESFNMQYPNLEA